MISPLDTPETSRAELSADALEAIAVDTPLLPPREPLGLRMASYFGRHLLLLFWLSFGALWAILSSPSVTNRPDFRVGDLAPRDYVAPQNAFLPDRRETQRRREAAAALVTPAYVPAPSAQSQALSALRETLDRSQRAAAMLRLPPVPAPVVPKPARGAKAPAATRSRALSPEKRFQSRAGWLPTAQTGPTLRALTPRRWDDIGRVAELAVRQAYLKGRIRSDVRDDFSALRPLLRQSVAQNGAFLTVYEREIALQLAQHAAHFPNVVVNQRATDQARDDASNAVLPVFLRVEANTPLVQEGERVSAEQFEQLQELGLISPRFRPFDALAHGALCLLLVSGAAAYLAAGRRDLIQRPAALWLVAVVPIGFVAGFRFFLVVPHADFMMVPLAATAAMLLTVLIDTRVGLPAGFVVAALCALMGRADAGLFLAATLSAWIGSLSVAQLSSRFALLRSIALLTIANAILAFSLGILRESPPEELLSSVIWNASAGAISVVAMAGLAIFLERPFGITSHLRLLELLAPDETVIRRMQLEAPGTYTHSMTVAILAEAAAKVVGADPLLCRVAGLYHDIGKLRRPHCFIENQGGDNIHDRLSPGLSALLIKAHVKDGLELGRAVRLPAPVLDIVASHHGTGIIAYFWHRARQIAENEGHFADERTFRYAGPKPRSREAAIVMLADSVEASARSLPQITPESLECHVAGIVAARLDEGELDECDLSLREMAMVREAFVTVLRGVLHGRIAYPDPATLSGELVAPSDDWVRQTLGEDGAKAPRNAAKNSDKNAAKNVDSLAPGASRRPKGKSRAIESDNKTDNKTNSAAPSRGGHASGTKNEGTSAPDIASSPRTRRRRFKPPFHATAPAPGNGTSPISVAPQLNALQNGQSSRSDARADASTEPQLEPRRASLSAPDDALANGIVANGAALEKSGANGHCDHAASGPAALSGAPNPVENP